MRNTRAADDTRHARTGKDGLLYNQDGVLLATVEQFTSNVTYNNSKYSVLVSSFAASSRAGRPPGQELTLRGRAPSCGQLRDVFPSCERFVPLIGRYGHARMRGV